MINAEDLIPEFHPLLPNPTKEEVMELLGRPGGPEQYADFLNKRERRIALSKDGTGEPYNHGWYLDHWKKADLDFKLCEKGQFVGGGKRASKSERAAWLVVRAMMMLPGTLIWAMQGNMKTSQAEQQTLIWKYLPLSIKALNGKSRHNGNAKVDYAVGRGFAGDILVFPNGSRLYFLSYDMDPEKYQGWGLGCKCDRRLLRLIEDDPRLFNIGAWLDENMPLPWFDTVQTRCITFESRWLWTFSPINGITPTIKTVLGTAETVESAPAELLPQNRVHVPGLRPGHMPIRQRPSLPGVSVFYFWSEFNPFPPNYKGVKDRAKTQTEEAIKQDAYGYGSEVQAKAHPKFGAWNIIKPEQLPAEGTNYMIADPAGARMYAAIWVRVAPGNPETFYVYRDWPSKQVYGDWAVIAPTNDQPDGIEGPAQRSQGMGWIEYKRRWLAEELIDIGPAAMKAMRDPQRIAIAQAHLDANNTSPISEEIMDRLIDPRAGRDQKASAEGMTTPIDEFAENHLDPKTGEVLAPPMYFRQAAGQSIDTGITALNELLDWDTQKPLCKLTNEPHFYVTEDCQQVIGCLSVYTATGGEKAGWKDIHDLLRYMATSGLVYVAKSTLKRRSGCGGY